MASRPQRSLRREYELYLEDEIENYKESISRSALLSIGDEAARNLASEQQFALTELLLCEEVDRLIARRLRLPAYSTWRRRRVKVMAELRRPERWGLRPDDAIVRAVHPSSEGHVLLAGVEAERSALYLAANGCEVTAIGSEEDSIQRVIDAAEEAGLGERVHVALADLSTWVPASKLVAVVCAAHALADLSPKARARAIEALQRATADGGVHLVKACDDDVLRVNLDELMSKYRGWDVSVERSAGELADTFLARKIS
ncbi:MAG: hypothetical protein ACYC3Q_11600 [Gemmatimonadaceae bacterium]